MNSQPLSPYFLKGEKEMIQKIKEEIREIPEKHETENDERRSKKV